ncbi:Bet3-like_protein [Hexamita inflata]|uniref:Bet3-like protein n=1 Tax=Hexamita inflata TaxID=28002 RepID=A0AA86QW17_9EUKA|nr:Bet3-like protein [Hexamita inflata]CAI9931844.1 Bet3-like protein [Hexamita inflata]CAI9933402.1 Bet3-like protein [Hexamita inflata]CAI9958580.1 Bet3-like protein [Hexamita inflata]
MSGQTLTTLLYGAIVNQILEQEQDPEKTTEILNQFGLSIGSRLVDDYVSRFPTTCQNFKQVAEGVQGALIHFLDMKKDQVQIQQQDDVQFQLCLQNNPLEQYVKVPAQLQKLCYCQIIAGAVVGALRQLMYECEATYVDGILKVKLLNKVEARFAQQ